MTLEQPELIRHAAFSFRGFVSFFLLRGVHLGATGSDEDPKAWARRKWMHKDQRRRDREEVTLTPTRSLRAGRPLRPTPFPAGSPRPPLSAFPTCACSLLPPQFARELALRRAYGSRYVPSGHPVDELRKYYMLVVLLKGGVVAVFLGGAGQALVSQGAQLWVLSAAAGLQASLPSGKEGRNLACLR